MAHQRSCRGVLTYLRDVRLKTNARRSETVGTDDSVVEEPKGDPSMYCHGDCMVEGPKGGPSMRCHVNSMVEEPKGDPSMSFPCL